MGDKYNNFKYFFQNKLRDLKNDSIEFSVIPMYSQEAGHDFDNKTEAYTQASVPRSP